MKDYDKTYANFSWQRPNKFNFATDIIDQWAAKDANHPAIHWIDDFGGEQLVSFADHSRRSKQVANVLSEAGVNRGDIVLLILGRQLAWWEVVTACLRAGIIVSPGTRSAIGEGHCPSS